MRNRIVVCAIIFFFLPNIVSVTILKDNIFCSASPNNLELQEGMKYSYSGFNGQLDLFITKNTEESWEGILVNAIDITYEGHHQQSTRAYRIKILKETLDLYETSALREKNLFDEDVIYKKITSESSQSGVTRPFVFALNKNLYGFNMEELIEKKTLSMNWSGELQTNLTIEGPLEYNNYNAYKITADYPATDYYTATTTIYYVSTVFPFLLIYQEVSYWTLALNTVEEKAFNSSDYIFDSLPNGSPIARFSYTVENYTIIFNASESYDSDGRIVNYQWDFGDETNGTEKNPTHTYTSNGEYQVKLKLTDDEGSQSQKWVTIIINVSSQNQSENLHLSRPKTPGFEFILIITTICLFVWLRRTQQKR